jgi:peptidoglycan/LPS O-acetylase OafA/YrhL
MSRADSGYHEEIDGLRALAILAVVIYHATPGWLSGGFLGVDVFFVISGFLISRLILRKTAGGNFSLPEFYQRRAKRLLPVFLLTLVLTWLAGWQLLFPDELRSLGSASFAACLSFSNYHFSKGAGYFDPQAETNPLLHTWSLAVEEQFYLVFPFILQFFWRREEKRGRFFFKAAGTVVVLFIVSLLLTRWKPARAFYGLESRAWELGAGFLVAVFQNRFPTATIGRCDPILAIFGLLMCVTSFVVFTERSAIPAPVAFMPVIGTVILIMTRLGGIGTPLYRLATLSPVRYLGRISYSLYLIHWPVLVFQKAHLGWESTGTQWTGVVVAFALAIAVHHAIENPIRYARNPVVLGRLGWAGLALLIGLGGLAKFVRLHNGYVKAPCEAWLRQVLPESGAKKPPAAAFINIGEPGQSPELFLLGDSHAQCLVESMHEQLLARHRAGACWVAPSTIPGRGIISSEYSRRFSEEALERIAKGDWKTIILCANWSIYLDVDPNDRKTQQRIKNPHNTVEEGRHLMEEGLYQTIRTFTEAGKKVVVVYPIPRMDRHVPIFMAKTLMRGGQLPRFLVSEDDYFIQNSSALRMLDTLKARTGFAAIQPLETFTLERGIRFHEGHQSYYEDPGHLSHLGATRLVTPMLQRLLTL